LFNLTGHASTVWRILFSPDGAQLATTSGDGTVKIWDGSTGQELLTLTGHTNLVTAIAFSPDGRRLYTASDDGTVRVFLLDIQELMDLARSRLTRTWTKEECQKFLHLPQGQCPAP
jgi:WD40 repeat protein